MKIKALVILFAAEIIGFSSCKKNGEIVPVVTTGALNVINASTDTLNFYQNGTRLNNNSNLYPFGQLGYISVVSGAQNFQLKKAGSPNTLVGVPLTLAEANGYTLFAAGETADKVFLLKDTLYNDTTRIRFVNASPITGTLDVTIGHTALKNVSFKTGTGFMHVDAGKPALIIYQAGNTTPLSSGKITLVAGSSYTVFTKGVLNGTGNNAFGARILLTK